MKKETKKFWESLKLKNEALFNEFKFAIVGEVVKGNDLVIGYNEETNDLSTHSTRKQIGCGSSSTNARPSG